MSYLPGVLDMYCQNGHFPWKGAKHLSAATSGPGLNFSVRRCRHLFQTSLMGTSLWDFARESLLSIERLLISLEKSEAALLPVVVSQRRSLASSLDLYTAVRRRTTPIMLQWTFFPSGFVIVMMTKLATANLVVCKQGGWTPEDVTTFGFVGFSRSSFSAWVFLIRLIRCLRVLWLILNTVLLLIVTMVLCVFCLIFSKDRIQSLAYCKCSSNFDMLQSGDVNCKSPTKLSWSVYVCTRPSGWL